MDRSVIDGLKDLREPGQPDPLRELVELFFRDAEPRVAQMNAAAESGDLAKLGASAHTLKGSASNLGARRLSGLCSKIEKQAKAGDKSAIELLPAAAAEFEAVKEILRKELEN